MRRAIVVLVAFAGLVRPAYAADATAPPQQDVAQQLAATSAKITQLDQQIAAQEQTVSQTQGQVNAERAQVRLLARLLYVQPSSLVTMVFQASSLSQALTEMADLTSAGDRAAATQRTLERDLARVESQEQQLQAELNQQVQLKKQLEAEYSRLVAASSPADLPSTVPTSLPTSSTSVAAIKQIILDAFAPLGAAAQNWALAVAKCESNYNPYAVNSATGAAGLFQFLPSTWAFTPEHALSPFDPQANAEAAEWLYQRDGPSQWACSALV